MFEEQPLPVSPIMETEQTKNKTELFRSNSCHKNRAFPPKETELNGIFHTAAQKYFHEKVRKLRQI